MSGMWRGPVQLLLVRISRDFWLGTVLYLVPVLCPFFSIVRSLYDERDFI